MNLLESTEHTAYHVVSSSAFIGTGNYCYKLLLSVLLLLLVLVVTENIYAAVCSVYPGRQSEAFLKRYGHIVSDYIHCTSATHYLKCVHNSTFILRHRDRSSKPLKDFPYLQYLIFWFSLSNGFQQKTVYHFF